MQFFLLGLAALVLVLLTTHAFTRANPAAMARQFRIAGGSVALAGAALFLVRGMTGPALLLAAFGSWLLGWGAAGSWGAFPGSGRKSPGQTSRVVTDHLEMELDHDTGELTGAVLKGIFEGRAIESLTPAEFAHLWRDCRFSDPQSAQILEAYLDREHPSWREDLARSGQEPSGSAGTRGAQGPQGPMSVAEAYQVLGLAAGASDEDIRRAHRELMLKLHPDRGGSTYLAAKINQAKDLLLSRSE
ncbi:MAG TPA: DnaJ domain-containing protein [Hyphomicrobiaceae bacterium]|nr:DnaJ domain-containing protein [Hyphomicrobiaceae bacterium]